MITSPFDKPMYLATVVPDANFVAVLRREKEDDDEAWLSNAWDIAYYFVAERYVVLISDDKKQLEAFLHEHEMTPVDPIEEIR